MEAGWADDLGDERVLGGRHVEHLTFDDEMEKFGLARREREVELQMSAQVTTTVTTTGSDEDAIASATSYVDHDAVAEALRRGDWEHGGAVEAEVM